jgi:hypothetical protein
VRGALVGAAFLAGLILIAAILGKVAATAQLTLGMVVALVIARRIRGFPMGAAGTISATKVTTHSVGVFGVALAVPMGRYPLSAFQSIVVEDRMVMHPSGGDPLYAEVYLVGGWSDAENSHIHRQERSRAKVRQRAVEPDRDSLG